MRLHNGIYEFNTVIYEGKKYEVLEVKNNRCKLKDENNNELDDIDVYKCKKVEE